MTETHKVPEKKSKVGRNRYHPDRFPFVPPLLAGAIHLLHRSCRFTVLGQEHEAAALSHGRSLLYACWHFAYPAVIYHFRNRNGMLMVSRSRDGEWIARVLKYLGYLTARGSPGKGGGIALREMIAHIRGGNPVGLIADGSQGPPCVAQKGILILTRHARAPLVPVSMAADPSWRFATWDRTLVPKPFSRVVMAYGEPLWVRADDSPGRLEEIRQDLQNRLNQLTRQAEAALGDR